jgi:hypothetical protein
MCTPQLLLLLAAPAVLIHDRVPKQPARPARVSLSLKKGRRVELPALLAHSSELQHNNPQLASND